MDATSTTEGSGATLPPGGLAAAPAPPAGAVVAAVAGLAAGWLAAGSTGLLAHSLRHALTWVALGVALVAAWPSQDRFWTRLLLLLAGLAVAVMMTASTLAPVNVLAVAFFLGLAASARAGLDRRTLLLASAAVAVLGVYRLAATSIPLLWLGANTLGRGLGLLAGRLTGTPLWVGATFGGLDFLVAMAAFYVGWLSCTARPRLSRGLRGAAAIAAGHLAYLTVLSLSADWLPAPAEAPRPDQGWSPEAALRTLVPWNLPALACAIHLAIAAAMLRWADWHAGSGPRPTAAAPLPQGTPAALGIAGLLLAAALPIVATLSWGRPALSGKTIVLYEKGFLNWLKPQHGDYGRYSVGMYGLLPTFVESLGARCRVSPDLAEADLADACVLILLYPNEPWEEGQLERIWDFARRGGSLVVFGEHTVREKNDGSRFNEALAPTQMRVRFDSATFEVGGWLHSYEALAHPATAGIGDERNELGVVIGASVALRWPARPLLVGRWGWADPGDPGSSAALMGNGHYDPGEKLGDIVLAAEQPFGAGRVVAFGDTSGMTNGIMAGSHVSVSRLLAYLAGGVASPQATWRQALGLLMALGLVALLMLRPADWLPAPAALLAALSLTLCTAASHRVAEVLPDGSVQSPNNLAYLDATHVEANSDESDRPDGTMGLALTLMRNGYLTLHLPEFTAERLKRAGLLVSVAPSRAFSAGERKIVRDFVEDGGIFIATVGWDESGPSRQLLADFGLYVGGVAASSGGPADAPPPLGHFKSPYVNFGDAMVYVRFHAAWPIECTDRAAKVIANGLTKWRPDEIRGEPPATDMKQVPVIIERRVGLGKVVLVGDTAFATNQNLENMDGQPFEGLRENADFWRWFLARLRGQPEWLPPRPEPPAPPAAPPDAPAAQP